MHGGVIIDKGGYHLNIDSIMEADNITYYVSGNVIPDLSYADPENRSKTLRTITDIMKDRNISLIVDLSNYNHDFPKECEFKAHNILHLNYKISDKSESLTDDSSDHLESLIQTIVSALPKMQDHLANRGGNVLIHCFMGQNRSQLIFIAYMMLVHNFSYYDIRVELMKNRGKFIISNPLFIALLYHISVNRDKYRMLMNISSLDLKLDNFVKEIKEFMLVNRVEILESESRIHKQYLRYLTEKSYHKNLQRLSNLLTKKS